MKINKLLTYALWMKRKKIKRSQIISGTVVVLLMAMLVGYQNCSSKSSGASNQPTADQIVLSEDLATLTNRMLDLQILLSGMIDAETQERLESEKAIITRIDEVSNDLKQFKNSTSSAISSLHTQNMSLQTQMTSQTSDLNSKIASVQTDLNNLKNDSNYQMNLLNQSLANSIKTQTGILQDLIHKNKQEILDQLKNDSNLTDTQIQDLTNKILTNENKIISIAKAHDELKTQLATNYSTKEDLNKLGIKVEKLQGKGLLQLAQEKGGTLEKSDYFAARENS
jgi:hypothetical protein